MSLAEAIERFLASHGEHRPFHQASLILLKQYFNYDTNLEDISRSSLRDFLARSYLQNVCSSTLDSSRSIPDALDLLDSLTEFCKWADEHGASLIAEFSPVAIELCHSLPRAIEITDRLSSWLRQRRGSFSFPEFMTSFEEGGHSEYDIDAVAGRGALEGYFRITRVQGVSVEAEEIISQERVWPILFPGEVSGLLEAGYIVNLELLHRGEGWEIVDCGFAYPPGTEL
jgi:hypothetical protein